MDRIVDTRDEPKIEWYRSPIDRDILRTLTRRSDIRALLHIGAFLGLLLLTGGLTYYAWLRQAWFWVVMGCYVHATFWTFCSPTAATHELSHLSVFKTPILNRIFGYLFAFLSWSDPIGFRASHLWHHQLTCHQQRDLEVVLPQTMKAKDWIYAFLFDPLVIWNRIRLGIRQSRGVFKGEWPTWIFRDPKVVRERAVFARFLLAGHAALALLFLFSGQWILLFLVTLPSFYANWLGNLIGFTQHAGMQPNVPDHRLCCRSVKLNPLFQFLYWNMNYHVEHHMYAGVPFYNLPRLRKAIEADLPPITPGLLVAWRDIYHAQRRQKADPDYYLPVALPISQVACKAEVA